MYSVFVKINIPTFMVIQENEYYRNAATSKLVFQETVVYKAIV